MKNEVRKTEAEWRAHFAALLDRPHAPAVAAVLDGYAEALGTNGNSRAALVDRLMAEISTVEKETYDC
jgi:hypothetical protein